MAGPPPPPPPPPPPSTILPSRRWKTEDPQRLVSVQSAAKPASDLSSRPNVDSSALQHAASRLRKTEYGESLRSDQSNLSDGRMDRETQSSSGRNWKNSTQFSQLGGDQTREEIPPSSTYTYQTSPSRDILAGRSYPLKTTTTTTSQNSFPSKLPSSVNNNTQPYYKSLYTSSALNYSTPASNYSMPASTQRTLTRNESPWVSEIDDTINSANIYSTPTKSYHNASSDRQNNQGLLYSTISKIEQQPSTNTTSKTDPNDFARQLRDTGLTDRQRAANQAKCMRTVEPVELDATRILQEATKNPNDEITRLLSQMKEGMKTTSSSSHSSISSKGNVCVNCGEEVSGSKPGCTALNQIFHVACFVCSKCKDQLAGSSFYNVDGKPICEKDYIASLEKCTKCGNCISDRLLRAVGGAYHVNCFTCVVCSIALDGIPFTVDSDNRVHCVPCFHEQFAPRCAVCSKPIVPDEGEKESVRVVAMEKSFHVECYRCEDCCCQLSSKIEGQGCYPLDSHLYCKTCNANRLRVLSSS